MNNHWIDASHESAENYKENLSGLLKSEKMYLVRVLDIIGLFETGWLVFEHVDTRFGYPHYESNESNT